MVKAKMIRPSTFAGRAYGAPNNNDNKPVSDRKGGSLMDENNPKVRVKKVEASLSKKDNNYGWSMYHD